ncbi:MAG: peptidase MA family metallohydrolase [Dehalococcoidia bacterium]|nr:peptidase MA family metallohydrolase [Dehalococcoidia bacterium]
MIRRVASIILALLFLLSPSLVAAETGIAVIASDVDVNFPSRAVFTVQAESYVDIVDVRLYYRVDMMNYAEVVSEGWADFTPANSIVANWVWDMTNASLPPGAEVTYWWMIEDDDGNRVETSPKIMRFDDSRFTWRSLTSSVGEGGGMTLFWYTGGDSFARELMDTCEEGLARLTQDIGTYLERPIKIYIYASGEDLQGAMIYSQEWTGGVAFPDFGIIVISIPPSQLEWGERALVHELTHLVVHQATFSPYGQLPLWLDEGLATYSEGELDPDLRSSLNKAILESTLISVRSLCSPFSAYADKARLSYAQSYSLVEYLLDNHGQDKMLDLLTILKQGSTYDEALTAVYGFDIDDLDASWRATLAPSSVIAVSRSPEQSEGTARESRPALIAALAALATGLALWGAVALEKQTRRSSSGKSTM